MFLKIAILVVGLSCWASSAAVRRDLSPNQEERLGMAEWRDGDKENVWELSGQFEGDIVLGEARNGILPNYYRWPDFHIPYEFDPSVTEEQRRQVDEVVKIFGEETCFSATPRAGEGNYVYITNGESGCWSSVGRQGGKQVMNLQSAEVGSGCFSRGAILHEFLHAIGFYHMQNTVERDDYVDIKWENIAEDARGHFEKLSPRDSTDYLLKYDYGSIMHFGPYAFSANGQRTIEPKDPNAVIGQREDISAVDLQKVGLMYVCEYWGTSTTTEGSL